MVVLLEFWNGSFDSIIVALIEADLQVLFKLLTKHFDKKYKTFVYETKTAVVILTLVNINGITVKALIFKMNEKANVLKSICIRKRPKVVAAGKSTELLKLDL